MRIPGDPVRRSHPRRGALPLAIPLNAQRKEHGMAVTDFANEAAALANAKKS
jgi:hypothetical protein